MIRNKILLGLIICSFSTIAFADMVTDFEPGPVVGIQAGDGYFDEGGGLAQWATTIYSTFPQGMAGEHFSSKWNFVGRGYVGYNFIPYFGLEAGYQYFPGKKNSASGSGSGLPTQILDSKVDMHAFDLFAKLNLPLQTIYDQLDGCSVYMRLGGAFVQTHVRGSYNMVGFDQTVNAVRPAYGLGASYNFNDNFAVDFAWIGFYGKDRLGYDGTAVTHTGSVAPNMNMLTVGVSYKFTDIF